jgi:hypothetical protein
LLNIVLLNIVIIFGKYIYINHIYNLNLIQILQKEINSIVFLMFIIKSCKCISNLEKVIKFIKKIKIKNHEISNFNVILIRIFSEIMERFVKIVNKWQ